MYYTDFYPAGPGVKGTTVPMLTEARVGEILDELDLAVEDSVLSRDEKARILIPLNLELFSNYDAAIAAANTFGLSTAALVAAKNAWVSLRDGLSPAWDDTAFNTDIDRSLFRVAINNFIAAIAEMNSILTAEAARRADVDGGLTDGGVPITREEVITSEGISLSTMNLGVGPLIRSVDDIFTDIDLIEGVKELAEQVDYEINDPASGIRTRVGEAEIELDGYGAKINIVEASLAGGGISVADNVGFDRYPEDGPGKLPTDWVSWIGGVTSTRRVPDGDGWAVEISKNGSANAGIQQLTKSKSLLPNSYYVYEVIAEIPPGSDWTGAAAYVNGAFENGNGLGDLVTINLATEADDDGIISSTKLGKRSWSRLFATTTNEGLTRARHYVMAGWTTTGAVADNKIVTFYRSNIRKASASEVELRLARGASTSLNAKITEVNQARVDGDAAITTRTTALEAKAVGPNMLTKAQFFGNETSITPFAYYESSVNFNFQIRDKANGYAIPGEGALQIFQGGRVTTDPYANLAQVSTSFAVEKGKKYCLSAYSGAISCYAFVIFYWVDSAGNYISETPGTGFDRNLATHTGSNPSNINTLKRIYAMAVAPENAVNAVILLRKYDTLGTAPESYAFFSRLMFGEVPLTATEPPPWSPGATEARLQVQEVASADLYGRTRARWALGAAVPGATAFIEAQAETSPGAAPTSSVAIGATQFTVYNPSTLGYKKALEVVNGNVLLTGGLQAGAFIRLGNGNGWPVALKPVDFSAGDGEVVNFGTDLGTLPALTFSQAGLAPLSAGETYNLYADNLTATGFTMRAKISIPATPTNNSLTGTSTAVTISGKGGRKQIRGALDDSADGTFRITASGSQGATIYGSGTGFPQADNEVYVDTYLQLYALKGSTWTLIASPQVSAMFDPDDYPAGPNSVFSFWDLDEVFNVGTGATEYALVVSGSSNGQSGLVNDIKVYWQSAGTGSGVRSATPSGQKVKVTVRPQ